MAVNCVDRHVEAGHGDQVAFHWEGEPGDSRTITYADLQREVCKAANALIELGVESGDRVAIQLPMIPEAAVAMLACARLGAAHSVVFGGFSPSALKTRIEDAEAKLLITSDGQYRRGKPAPMKENTDQAVAETSTIEHVLVVRRTETEVPWTEGRDVWWHDIVDRQSDTHEAEAFDAEQPLFILYTSGTTGKPKGILHTSGGYLTQAAYTHNVVFDHKPGESVYWCTADIGWVTGHSYIVYGPLANRATSVMYEGTPNTPHEGRHWEIIQKYGVSIYYTAPTLIRTFMKWGKEIPEKYDLSSLRVLGSVGEPINPEAWMWYRENIGRDNCPIVDTWWQTETGAIMICAAAGRHRGQAGLGDARAARYRRRGRHRGGASRSARVAAATWCWTSRGRHAARHLGRRGALPRDVLVALRRPGLLLRRRRRQVRRRRRDLAAGPRRRRHERVRAPHLDHRGGVRAGQPPDGGRGGGRRRDRRADRAGHRRVRDPARQRGQRSVQGEAAIKALRDHVAKEIGPIAKPRQIMVVDELPKTRSGKIMRRLLRDVAEHREVGDVTTLADSSVMDLISQGLEKGGSSED